MKKHYFKLIIAVFALSIMFTSCEKNDADESSHFTYQGVTYDLTQGFQIYDGETGNVPISHGIAIIMISEGISADGVNGGFIGTGNIIAFYMFSSSTELVSGTYQDEDSEEVFASDGFDMGINFDLENSSPDDIIHGSITSVIVEKSGTTYEITFSGMDVAENPMSGYFKGSLTSESWGTMLKSAIIKNK